MITEKSPFDGKSFREILQKNKLCQINYQHPKLKANRAALDLLQRMCEVDPEKRITPREALKHKFFTDIEDHSMIIEDPNENERFEQYY